MLLLAAVPLTACSAFVSSYQTVTIRSLPEQAEISVDGQKVGTGMVQVELERDHAHLVEVELGGKKTARVIDHGWSTVGTLDALGSIVLLFPGIGLLFSGARSLEPSDLVIDLP